MPAIAAVIAGMDDRNHNHTRTPNPLRTGALLLALLAPLLAGCLNLGGDTASPSDRRNPATNITSEPGTARTADADRVAAANYLTELPPDQVGVCVDASASVNPAVVAAASNSLSTLGSKLAPLPSQITSERGYPGSPSTHLVLRQVATAALGLENEVQHLRLPGVPALSPEPTVNDGLEIYRDGTEAWAEASSVVEVTIERATEARSALKSELESIEFRDAGSEIVGCLTALAETFDPAQEMDLFLVSDLDQRGEPQARGNLTNARVRVLHDCQDVGVCEQQQTSLRSLLEQLGVAADRLTFSSPSRLSIELDAALKP